MKKILALMALVVSIPVNAGDFNLGQIREKLVNQPVRISGRLLLGGVDNWARVQRQSDSSAKFGRSDRLPADYAFAKGNVVSVELADTRVVTKDAFGKDIDFSKVKDPYVNVIVKLADGTEVGTTAYEYAFHGNTLQLIEEAERTRRDIEAILAKLDGKSLYLPMYQHVYPNTVAFDDLLRVIPSTAPLPFDEVPRATPLKIIETKYLDGYNRALIRIALPNGNEGIMVGTTDAFYLKREYKPSDLDRLGFNAEQSMSKFTPREITAIKNVEFFKGMSQSALYWSVGLPTKENDYGRGGKQLVFATGLIVYTQNDRVTSYQHL